MTFSVNNNIIYQVSQMIKYMLFLIIMFYDRNNTPNCNY